jgi:hypothetical protein
MLNILGMIILIIILFIIILLIVGIKIKLEYNKKGSEVKGCLKILIFKKLKIYTYNFPSSDNDQDKDEETKHERDHKKLFDLAKPCFKYFKNYLKSILNVIKIKRVENHLVFGLESYADTGKYIGIIWAILAVVNPMHDKLKLSAEPSFTGSVLDAQGINEVEIYPLKILTPTIKLISKKEVRTFIRGVLDER